MGLVFGRTLTYFGIIFYYLLARFLTVGQIFAMVKVNL